MTTTETLSTETLEAVPLSHRRRTRNFPKHFAPLESYAAASGLDEAGYLLQRARMWMIEAHASKPARQTDVRVYFDE